MALGLPKSNFSTGSLDPKYLPLVSADRPPTVNDREYRIATIWWDRPSADFWILATFTSGVPLWRLLIGGGGDITSLQLADLTIINPDGNGRIQTVSPNNTLTFTASGSAQQIDITAPVPVAYGGTGLVSYTAGDVLYASGATTLTKLPIGTVGQALTVSAGGIPEWTTDGGGTVTSVTGTVDRILITGTATDPIINIATTYAGQTSITTLGTIATGTWEGTAVGPTFGGTGLTTYTTGDILYSSAPNVLSKLPIGTAGQALTVSGGGIPQWSTDGGGTVTSVSGTADRITVGGTATDPIVDIAATYVGQTSITTLGTVATGTWQGTAVGPTFGGTGQTTYATGDILYASAPNVLSKLTAGADGEILKLASGVPSWGTDTNGFTWNTVAGTSGALVANNGYVTTNVGLTTLTLPASCVLGSTYRILVKGAGLVTVAQNASDTIRFGNVVTTAGITGSLTATAIGDCLEILCVGTNEFFVVSSIGTWVEA